MDWLKIRRFFQILRYGLKDSKEISSKIGLSRWRVFIDIFKCFYKYYIFSDQYKAKEIWKLKEEDREEIVRALGRENQYKDDWEVERWKNNKFFFKYSSSFYDTTPQRHIKRQKEYAQRYNMGEKCYVWNNVQFERQHFLPGVISIGKGVIFSKNIYIDYSGEVIIRNNVGISNGVIIESHEHPFYTNPAKDIHEVVPKRIVIEDGVIIGTRAMIHASVGVIGRNARVGAYAVLRHSVPPYAIVMGNPAKVVGFSMTPEQVEEYERDNYPESERISIEKYTKDYNKLFLDRIDEIKIFLKKTC